MGTDVIELQMRDSLGEHHETTVPGWAKRWNRWSTRGALRCHFMGKDTDSPLEGCREEVD